MKHDDAVADRAMVKKMVKKDALTGKAKGGMVKKKSGAGVRQPVSAAPAQPPARGAAVPVAGLGALAGPASVPSAPPAMKRGGAVKKAETLATGGAGGGLGRLHKAGKK